MPTGGLNSSDDLFRNLVEQLREGILAVDLDARVTYSNPKMAQMLGLTLEELQGKSMLELLDSEARQGFLDRLKAREEGLGETYEMSLRHKEGQWVLFSVSGNPLKGEGGRITGAYAVLTDITDQRRSELALKDSETKFRSVFENMQDVFYRSDWQGRMILMSPSGARILGYESVDELLGQSIPESMYLVPADHTRFAEALAESGVVTNFEETLRKKDGTPVIISTNSHYYYDEAGCVLGVEGIFFDITERKRTEQALREKEAIYRRIVENIRDIIVSYGIDGTLTFLSESARSLGYEPGFGIGHNIFEFVHPEDHPRVTMAFALTLKGTAHDRVECRLRHGDGRYEWYEVYSAPMYLDGVMAQVNGVIRNIQERKVAEESLKEREAMYRALVEHSHDGIFIIGGDRFLFVNPRATGIVGYSLDELYAMHLWDLVHPEERAKIQENAARRVRGEDVPPRYQARVIHKNGSVLYVELSLSKIPFAGQWAVLGTLRDITERLESEEALKNSEERYRLLVENQGEGVGYVDDEERILFVNRAAEEIFSRPRADLLGHALSDFTDSKNFLKIQQETRKRKTGSKSTYEMVFIRPDGECRQVLVTVTPHTDDRGQFLGALGIFRDITSVKQAEGELKRLSTAIEQTSDSILVADITGTILYANPASERLLGIPQHQINGQSMADLNYGKGEEALFRERWRDVINGRPSSGRMNHLHADGTSGQTDTTLSPVRDDEGNVQFVVITSRDVTREAQLENSLRHSQKMEAIGVLAGGIAHDFNNLLMPILGFSELAQDKIGEDQPKLAAYLKEIQIAGHRAAELVDQILLFSRQAEQVKQPLNLHPIVKECLKLMRAGIPTTIPIEASVDENCGPVLADPSQIHQVVMNLCTNAYHAMRSTGGRLEVCLDRVRPDGPVRCIGGDLPPGDYVRLRISDTGCGIGPETQKQIFLPFFTTKKVGEGTGLGLSIVHGIVTSCGGGITLDSEVGRGSTFTVFLPPASVSGQEPQAFAEGLVNGIEAIMVVDDEEPIGQMLGDALDMLGYRVSVFQDSREALRTFQENPKAFDLLLTDYAMPNLTGAELAGRIWEDSPRFPVLLMTGYSEDLDETTARQLGFADLLKKPLPLQRLAKALRQAFDESKTRRA